MRTVSVEAEIQNRHLPKQVTSVTGWSQLAWPCVYSVTDIAVCFNMFVTACIPAANLDVTGTESDIRIEYFTVKSRGSAGVTDRLQQNQISAQNTSQ
jgi:hypothetical protein